MSTDNIFTLLNEQMDSGVNLELRQPTLLFKDLSHTHNRNITNLRLHVNLTFSNLTSF